MGAAAYNRGSAAISAQIDRETRPVEFEIMERLNGLPKYSDAGKTFGPTRFVFDSVHNVWWHECPSTGFGFWYKNIHEGVRRWQVAIVGYDNGAWLCEGTWNGQLFGGVQ